MYLLWHFNSASVLGCKINLLGTMGRLFSVFKTVLIFQRWSTIFTPPGYSLLYKMVATVVAEMNKATTTPYLDKAYKRKRAINWKVTPFVALLFSRKENCGKMRTTSKYLGLLNDGSPRRRMPSKFLFSSLPGGGVIPVRNPAARRHKNCEINLLRFQDPICSA